MIGLAIYTVPAGNQIVVGVNLMLLGMFMVPIIPVSMNFGSELTFPLSPAMTNGSLLMVGYAMGAVLGIICTPLAQYSPRLTMLLYSSLGLVASVCSIFMKEDLKKTKFALMHSVMLCESEGLAEWTDELPYNSETIKI